MLVIQWLALVSTLLLDITKAVNTFAPTWVTSSYVQANSNRLIDGDVTFTTTGNTATPTATIPFITAFTAVPNLGYGLSNYQGDDTLNNEMFQVNRTGLTTTFFSVLIQISGFTNIWVMEVRFIAISRSFPHHLNSFDNVPINYNGPPITNLSNPSTSTATYTNTIDYSAQAAATGSTYTTFSTPLSNNKILLFITSLFIVGSQNSGGPYQFNFYVDATPVSTTSYTLQAQFEIRGNISRLHFSMITFDQADVQASGQYSLIYDRPCYSSAGGFYPFPSQFITNFMVGWVQWSSPRHKTIIHFINTFGTVNSTYGVKMEPISVRNSGSFPDLLNRTCFTVFYLKTWNCPNNTFFDPAQDLCTQCPITNCITCLNLTVCSLCNATAQAFLNGAGQCQLCSLAGCLNCSSLTTCNTCNIGLNYVLLANQTCQLCNVTADSFPNATAAACQSCTLSFCLDCSSLTSCVHCNAGAFYYVNSNATCSYCDWGLNYLIHPTTFVCTACTIAYCLNCSTLAICQQCNQTANYFLEVDNHCHLCAPTNCLDCLDATACSVCEPGYILNSFTLLCQACLIPGCLNCSNAATCVQCNITGNYVLLPNSTCQLCTPPTTFVDQVSSQCGSCIVTDCATCSNLTACQTCDVSYYLLTNLTCAYCDPMVDNFINLTSLDCEACSIPNCLNCTSLTTCLTCDHTAMYLLNISDSLCYLCTLSDCLDCINFTACAVCDASTQYFLNFSTLLCEPCALTGCLNCSSLEVCQQCDNASNYGFDFTSPNMSLCGGCDVSCICDGYGLPWNTASQNCTPICGDGLIRVSEECDDNNTDSFDGCSSSCRVESYYVCDGGEPTTCNQTLYIEAEFLGIVKEGCNGFKITVITARFMAYQIAQNIHIINSGVTVLRVEQNESTIDIYAEYSRDIANETIQLHFSPGELLNITYSPSIPALYYSQRQCEVSNQVEEMLKAAQIICYAILILSILSCKIVGLELFGVLQLSYFTLSSHTYLNVYLQPLTKFRTFNGLNVGITSQTSQVPASFAKMGVAGTFINNCNVMLFILFGELIVALTIFMVGKIAKNQKIIKLGLRLLKQGFVTLVLFNIFNIAFSAGVHWKYASPTDEGYALSSIILFGTLAAVIICVVAMELTSEQDYGEFKKKFKEVWICQLYIPLTVVYRMVLGFYSAVKSDYDESTLIILAFALIFMMYMITNLPFADAFQNYRCFLIHITMLYTLLTTNYYRAMKSTTPIEVKGRIYTPAIIELILMVTCMGVSFVILAYEVYRIVRLWRNQKKTDNKKVQDRPDVNVTEQSFEVL